MTLIRMDIKSIVVGGGPVASLVVLCPHGRDSEKNPVKLPIRIGTVEASAISMGVERQPGGRPMTHDLLLDAIEKLGANVDSVRITSVSGTAFYAQLILMDATGEQRYLDARPSDAIAIAVRCGCDIYANQEVLDTATLPDFGGIEEDEKRAEMEEFHNFVENLSPDDFNVSDHKDGTEE